MTEKFIRPLSEWLRRRPHYRGQLRRHKNFQRNSKIREFWKSNVASAMQTGIKPRFARSAAAEAASKQFKISISQVRRALNDTSYLMDAAGLKHRLQELTRIAADLRFARLQHERIVQYEEYVDKAMLMGGEPTYAQRFAVKRTAEHFGITAGQVRRILDIYDIPRRKYKQLIGSSRASPTHASFDPWKLPALTVQIGPK